MYRYGVPREVTGRSGTVYRGRDWVYRYGVLWEVTGSTAGYGARILLAAGQLAAHGLLCERSWFRLRPRYSAILIDSLSES